MRYLVSGGGTGGHIYPALAVARALRDARPDVEIDYVGGVRGFERRIVAGDPMRGRLRYHQLVVRSLR
jgi:UDP-N-acetylglucosamine--N-acetylmuramyl-(pentapeptide) pyrophosphoryl-undecaprenol N-acetylglucosamine transferase